MKNNIERNLDAGVTNMMNIAQDAFKGSSWAVDCDNKR